MEDESEKYDVLCSEVLIENEKLFCVVLRLFFVNKIA